MQYRTFEKLGVPVSTLGYGTMRLPVLDGDDAKIDEAEAIRLIRKAIDNGVNYVDTAYMYHGGHSEELVGKALGDGYREKTYLATKMPTWIARNHDGKLEGVFQDQLRKLRTDHIDFYLLHNQTKRIWEISNSLGALEWLDEKKKSGEIRWAGFSFHDDLHTFKKIIDAYDWDFCQIQLNFMDAHYQAGLEGLEYAAAKGIPVVIMEPLKGGRLTRNIPPDVQAVWDGAETKKTPAEWGLRWLANRPEIMTILSGMGTEAQLDENIRVLSDAAPGSLPEEDRVRIEQAGEKYNSLIRAACTGCRYCMPCPQGIVIPDMMELYNEWYIFRDDRAKRNYRFTKDEQKPTNCVSCRACEASCPQHLMISDIMHELVRIFE